MYLNIKIKEDFRTLKKDTEYKFDFTNQDRYLIVGYAGISGMKDKAEIDTDFEKFYFISSEFDDPLSLDNSRSSYYKWWILLET